MVSSSFSSSSKRARAQSNGSPIASCLVDGCVSDLSKCREYHRRHKVCEVHSKTAIVMVGGREQRFCQQCSRFHLLVEFDEVKRSCRKRLEGHNRRRRKPQSLNSGAFMTNHQGTRFTSYPQIFSITTANSNWASIVKAEEVPLNTRCSPRHLINGHHEYEHFPVSSRGIYKDGKKFPFLQENVQAAPVVSACQPLLKTVSSATGLQNSRSNLYDSACALSLLSSPEVHSLHVNPCQDAASGDRIPIGQPLISAMRCGGLGRFYGSQALNSVSPTGFLCSGNEHEHVGTMLVSDSSDDFQCHGSFNVGGEGFPEGTPQTLSSWQ